MCDCPNCITPRNCAEWLLLLARSIKHPHDELITDGIHFDDTGLARASLAIAFSQMPARFRFQAMMEEWSPERIVQEMY